MQRCFLAHIPLRHDLPRAFRASTMPLMRVLASLLVVASFLFGAYYFYVKKLPSSEPGIAPTQEISLTGVTGDLMQIAEAERAYMALNGHCGSLEELTSSSNTLPVSRTERDGYFYSIQCSGENFTATARHAPAPAGSSLRYPNLAVDATMQVHEIN
jgi:hypothetical protein